MLYIIYTSDHVFGYVISRRFRFIVRTKLRVWEFKCPPSSVLLNDFADESII
jgi:hypothetical protein